MNDSWPPVPGMSPFAVEQLVASRIALIDVVPWTVQVSRTLRSVEVELTSPGDPTLHAEIKRVLHPLSVQIVWYEGSYEVGPEGR